MQSKTQIGSTMTIKSKFASCLSRNVALTLILLVFCVFSGCTKEDVGRGEKFTGEPEITVKLKMPSVSIPTSRAMEGKDENFIDKVDVLAFKVGTETNMDNTKFAYRTYGTIIEESGTDNNLKTIRVKLKISENATDKYHFVFIANARDELNSLFKDNQGNNIEENFEGVLKSTLLEQIRFNAYPDDAADDEGRIWPTTTGNMRYLPMWGDLPGTHVIESGNSIPTISMVQMIRAVARVNVRFHQNTKDNFKVEQIIVNHIAPEGSIAPLSTNFNATENKVTAPTEPTGMGTYQAARYKLKPAEGEGVPGHPNELLQNGLNYDGEWSAAINNTFYVPEHKNEDIQHLDRIAVLICGSYREKPADPWGTPTWYRVDFFDNEGNILDVLRNHSYNFMVSEIKGEGKETEEEAIEDAPYNIKTEVFEWNDMEMEEVYYDGMHFYSVAPREHKFGYLGTTSEGSRTIKVQTDSKYRHIYVTLKDGDENFFTGGIVPQPTPFPPGEEPDPGDTYIVEIPFDIPEYTEGNVPEFRKRELTIYINFKSQDDPAEKDKVRIPIKIIQTNDKPEFKIVKTAVEYHRGNGNPYDNYAWVFFNVEGYFDAATVSAELSGTSVADPTNGRTNKVPIYPGENSYTGIGTDIYGTPYSEYDQGVFFRLPYYGENGFIPRQLREDKGFPISYRGGYTYNFFVEIQGEKEFIYQTSGSYVEYTNYIYLTDYSPMMFGSNLLTFTVGGKWQREILWVVKDEEGNKLGSEKSTTLGEQITIDLGPTDEIRKFYLYYSLTGNDSIEDLESCQVQTDLQTYENQNWTYEDGTQYPF